MDLSLPDIIGEYLHTPKRLEIDGIQIAGYFEPEKIGPEEVPNLFIFLQNTYNEPVKVLVRVIVPKSKGLFRGGKPILKVQQPEFQLELSGAEAGLLTLPVTTTEHVQAGRHELAIELKVATSSNPQRVRPLESQSQLGTGMIDSAVGLNLVGSLGSTYVTKKVKQAPFWVEVQGEPNPPERAPKLKYDYEPVWVQDNLEFFNRAIHELNLRQIKLQNEITAEALFVNLYAESTIRFADAGLPLRIGEAIVMAKILTYSSQYFLSKPKLRNGLLVPIWERALEAEVDTTDGLHVIRTAGYHHLLKLSIAISFGILAKGVGKHYWPLVERQVVTDFIANSIEDGQELDEDFLYLPLLMAGILIYDKFKLEGENTSHTLALLKKAYETRSNLFATEEMTQANKIFQHLLNKSSK